MTLAASWLPHRICYLNDPDLIVWQVATNLIIAGAYFWIPLTLYRLWRKRRDALDSPALTLLFAGFIVLCGLTHVMDVIVIWWPVYTIDVTVRTATAVLSLVTAGLVGGILRKVITIKDRLSTLERRHGG